MKEFLQLMAYWRWIIDGGILAIDLLLTKYMFSSLFSYLVVCMYTYSMYTCSSYLVFS